MFAITEFFDNIFPKLEIECTQEITQFMLDIVSVHYKTINKYQYSIPSVLHQTIFYYCCEIGQSTICNTNKF